MHHANYAAGSMLCEDCEYPGTEYPRYLVTTFDQSKIKTVASAEQSVTEPLSPPKYQEIKMCLYLFINLAPQNWEM